MVFAVVSCDKLVIDGDMIYDDAFDPMKSVGVVGGDPVNYDLITGNAAFECGQTGCNADWSYKINNNTAGNPTVSTPEGNTITITNSDGYKFDWESAWPVCAVIVKAGEKGGDLIFYVGGAYFGSAYSPINPANGKPFEISHVTFCYNKPGECYEEETAWAEGARYVKKGNWAMFVAYGGGEKTVNLIADGGTYYGADLGLIVGTATFSAPVDGKVTITINLTGGAIFYYDMNDPLYDDNLKVQDYATAPKTTPSPGKFAWKVRIEPGSTTGSIVVPWNKFYGVHLDVAVSVPCE